ncbi:MAG: hypothetical protein IKA05_05845 [Clostridia bacterium]|nr:hypothetical protein [Clostridia bacterium]
MADRIRKRTKYLTVSAMLSALGVIFLALGAFIEVLDITTAVLASMLCIYAVIEMSGAYPWGIWVVTSILSLLLLPIKTPALFYALFAGFYPILKEKLERLKRPLAFVLKLAVFHLSLGAIVLLLRLFFPEQLDWGGMQWLPIAMYVLCVAVFLLYDLALTRVITFYLIRLRQRFRIK